jgi:hypothetical protein
VELFKYSPARNCLLQQEIMKTDQIEIQIFLEHKTRWNILERMIEIFLKILNPMIIISRQLKLGHLWKEDYYEIVSNMYVELLKTCSIGS